MPGASLARSGTDLVDPARARRSLYGVHPQKQAGLNFVGLHCPVGRLEADDMCVEGGGGKGGRGGRGGGGPLQQ